MANGVTDEHAACVRAPSRAVTQAPYAAARAMMGEPAGWYDLEWRCARCDELLAWRRIEGHELAIRSELVPLPTSHTGMPSFGLARRQLVRHKQRRAGGAFGETRLQLEKSRTQAPVYIYCPNRETCGQGQHIEVPRLLS